MAEEQYEIWRDDDGYIAVEFVTVCGEVVWFVVRLMSRKMGVVRCVARYDTAHGKPHLDLVDLRGRTVLKEWLLNMSFAEALVYAVRDFKEHYENYISPTEN